MVDYNYSNKMSYPIALKIILWSFKTCVEIVYLPVHLIRLFKTPRKCPSIEEKILLVPASQLAKLIRKKQVTSVEIIRAYIARIEKVNPIINAIIENRFQDALDDAKKVDEFIQNSGLNESQIEEKYPLLGVPITIKGSIAVAGMMHSAGQPDHLTKAKVDAVTVKYAKNAGAIPLLTSNVPELCLNWETCNKLVGTTANPYNDCRTPGGSSGGEASLLGSGASLIGIGSDIAGSLRLPAHNCGIWGHKPSPYAVSCLGHYPDCKNKDLWNKVFTLGPLARYASDLKLLLNIISEPNMKEVLKLNEQVDVAQLNVYYIEDLKSELANSTEKVIRDAIRKVVAHFDSICNLKCTEVNLPLMKYNAELSYLALLNVDGVENLFEDNGKGAYQELFRFLRCQSKHEFTSICYGVLRRNVDSILSTQTIKKINNYVEILKNDLLQLLGDNGVLILPTSPCEATYRGEVYRKIFNHGYCAIFNALGFPATNCPVTFTKSGIPISIQVVAAPNLDRLTLSVAEEIEKAFGGWSFN